MNISTGGPHILLFERDQQLVALLNSELQLAGYEIHTARTAVEVFDAIARYPVRLVLVNLAQAAAARREFWVALDTQRRGRGVQVLSFHCTNIAGYGPSLEEPDERSHTVPADMEVDGMLGLMNMVNAIRSRIAVSNTGAMSRPTASANTQTPNGTQATMPIPAIQHTPHNSSPVGSSTANTPPTPPLQPTVSSPSSPLEATRTPNPHQTDKIRAVIYPNQRTWSTTRDNSSGNSQFPPTREQPSQEIPWSARTAQNTGNSVLPTTPDAINATPASAPDPYHNGQGQDTQPTNEGSLPQESGLAQLSRMLQEQHPPMVEYISQETPTAPTYPSQAESSVQQAVRPNNAPPISTIAMRASPIQDMPTDRTNAGQSDTSRRRSDESTYTMNAQLQMHTSSPSPTLMSIAVPVSPSPVPPTPLSPVLPPTFQSATPPTQVTAPSPLPSSTYEDTTPPMPVEGVNVPFYIEPEPASEESEDDASASNGITGNTLAEQLQAVVKANATLPEPTQKTPDNALLLDIVQSLPPMPTPPPQSSQSPQVHQGRATRSLGSVLLEGHLVPQNRLEVALNVQRMLRSVDMNYQLGEILLMFKLLTPDQLLAASLVSYGLITPAQISALGRIRQELHSIGLEYDLENLLILFRILSSEQLREVRASWVG